MFVNIRFIIFTIFTIMFTIFTEMFFLVVEIEKRFENPVKHIRENILHLKVANYVHKKLHHGCLAEF